MSTVMRARNLSKWYGKHEAVRDVPLDIEPGALTAVIGPNRAGKSTTISMLAELAKPDGGVIEYNAQAPRIGVVFQGSVIELRKNLSIRARLYPATPRSRVNEAIAMPNPSWASNTARFRACSVAASTSPARASISPNC